MNHTIKYRSRSDNKGRCSFTLRWERDYHPGHPDGEYRVANHYQNFFADPRNYGHPPPEQDEAEYSAWRLGDYDNGESGCPNCGRRRLCICQNGNHRCEKCNWCPELNGYAPVDD